jgi:predicted phage terminase large subunit-like protein
MPMQSGLLEAKFLNRFVMQNPFIPESHKHLSHKQATFLLLPYLEALYGGAAAGGKSEALLIGGLMFVEVPGYSACILRRSYTDLNLPESLMNRAAQWLMNTPARWNQQDYRWTFPSGASLTFGYMKHERDKYRYQSAEFQYIAFDELTQFEEDRYVYMFSRLRRKAGVPVPLRMRSASNPGDIGHVWVKNRFVRPGAPQPFIPAKLADNPFADQVSYRESLAKLDPITRMQLEDGNWDVTYQGSMFKREWFTIVDDWPRNAPGVRFWDFASTVPSAVNSDPDWTSGCRMHTQNGQFWIVDVRHTQSSPLGVEKLVIQTAMLDGRSIEIWLEQEPGSSGKAMVDHYRRAVLPGWAVNAETSTGSKVERAKALSSAAESGNVFLVRGSWNADFLDEISLFPSEGVHDDQEDSASGAHRKCGRGVCVIDKPRGM